MKALTLWQPWASLMALGHKKVETRSWKTKYRGPIFIHSTKRDPQPWLGASRFSPEFIKALNSCSFPDQTTLPYGAVIASANLVHIYPTREVRDDLTQQELLFGNYEDGRYAWFFEDLKPVEPFFVKGNRLLWKLGWATPEATRKAFQERAL